jgi:hypothetical protein
MLAFCFDADRLTSIPLASSKQCQKLWAQPIASAGRKRM